MKKHILALAAALACAATASAKSSSSDSCAYCNGTVATTPSTTTTTSTKSTSTSCYFCGETTSSSTTITSNGKVVGSSDFSKVQTISGSYVDADGNSGTVTVKIEKYSSKKGTVKVTVTLKNSAGKKVASKSASFSASPSAGTASGSLAFSSKTVGTLKLSVAYDEDYGMTFEGESQNGWTVASDEIEIDSSDDDWDDEDEDDGGTLGSTLAFSVDASEVEAPENYDILFDLLPDMYEFTNTGSKWKTGSAPSIKYKKYKEDGETWYELTGTDSETKTNYSNLKLSYKPKKGTFTGSFKIYATNEANTEKKPSLKSYTAKISDGVVLGSHASGTAKVKVGKTTYYLDVTIETVD